jgi:hypothetical protein
MALSFAVLDEDVLTIGAGKIEIIGVIAVAGPAGARLFCGDGCQDR